MLFLKTATPTIKSIIDLQEVVMAIVNMCLIYAFDRFVTSLSLLTLQREAFYMLILLLYVTNVICRNKKHTA